MTARGHRWGKFYAIHWAVCAKCGLVALRNERTSAAIKAKCEGDE